MTVNRRWTLAMRDWGRRSPTRTILICAALVAGLALAHVWVRLQILSVGYEISRETQRRHDLDEIHQRLTLELRTRMDFARIERFARDRLQLTAPDPRGFRVLKVPRRLIAIAEGARGDFSGVAIE